MTPLRMLAFAAAAFTYVGGALTVGPLDLPRRPLFDGVAPPAPYRWVDPPPELAGGNQSPQTGVRTVQIGAEAGAATAATPDGQALLSMPRGVFPVRPTEESVTIRLVPLDPDKLGPSPEGMVIDGNAYRVEVRYRESGEPAAPSGPVIVFLRYPIHADRMLVWSGGQWKQLPSNVVLPSQQVWAETSVLGTFAAAAPGAAEAGPDWRVLGLVSGAAALVAAVAGLAVRRRVAGRQAKRRRSR
jgi:hypothetical protein